MRCWRFINDDWWPMHASAAREFVACDIAVQGYNGEFSFENPAFVLSGGAPFVYCVRTHAESGIFFRYMAMKMARGFWSEIRFTADENPPTGPPGQFGRQGGGDGVSRKRKVEE